MATTFEPYSGDGSATTFAFNHPSYQESDIKVTVDGAPYTNTGVTGGSPGATTFTIPNYTTSSAGNIVFNTAPGNLTVIRIFRDTNVDVAKATFQAGSSVKAADLNNTVTQLLYAAQEEQNQLEQTADIQDSAITSAKIKDDTIVNADIKSDAAIAGTKVTPAFGSQNLSTSGTAATGALTVTGNIAVSGTVDGRDVATDGSKLDGIEAGATADQTAAQIRTLVESATDSNVFTDADHTKLNNIETGATADQTSSDIKTLLASDNLTDAHLAANSVGTSEIKDDAVGPDQLINTSVTAGSYGGSTAIPSLTVDAQGRLTAVSNNVVNFDVVADTTPQLGGNLDVQTREITTSGTNQDITLTPTGSGTVTVKGTGSASGTVEVNTETNAKSIKIQAPTNANLAGDYTLTLPVNDGDNGQFLKTDGAGTLSWDTVSGGGGGGGTAAPNSAVALTESADGSRTDFTMNTTPTSAFNLVVSVNGVVQKPNAGTTIASSAEGFCISASTLKFATAPANGSSIFVTLFSATVASDRITEGNSNVDIFDDNTTSRAVVNLDGNEKFRINEDGQIGLGGANYGTDGQVLTSQGAGAAAQWESIPSSDLVNDTTPQLGGDLDVQNRKITSTATNASINLEPNGNGVVAVRGAGGADGTLQLNCSQNSHGVKIKSPAHSAGASYTLTLPTTDGNANQVLKTDGSGVLDWVDQTTDTNTTDLVTDTSPQLGGDLDTNSHHILLDDDHNLKFGNDTDLEIFHDSASTSNMINSHRLLQLFSNGNTSIRTNNNDLMIQCVKNGQVELYWDNAKKLETTTTGAAVTGKLGIGTASPSDEVTLYGSDPVVSIQEASVSSKVDIGTGTVTGYINIQKADGTRNVQISAAGYSYFNGGKVGIGTASPVGKLTVNSGNITLSDGYGFTNGADADKTFMAGTSGSSGHLAFGVNNTERLRINSAGQLLSGMTSANVGDANAIFAGGGNAGTNNYGKIYLSAAETNPGPNTALSFIGTSRNDVSNNALAFIGVHSDGQHASGDYPTRFGFWTTNAGASGGSEKLRIHSGGTVNIPSGLTLGQAITSTAAGNTLDDYEEGVWTPVLQGYTGTQWDNVTYDNALDYTQGNYVKIGSLVYIYFYTGNFSLNSGWNNAYARINGLPFVFRNASPYYGGSFQFTHTNCFKNGSYNLFDCHSAYGVFNETYFNPSIGNSSSQARWGSESDRYIMVAGTYQTNV